MPPIYFLPVIQLLCGCYNDLTVDLLTEEIIEEVAGFLS